MAVFAVLLSTVGWTGTLALAWMGTTVFADLPTRDAVQALGKMPRATTIHDLDGRVVFTLFREQRIEVPLSQMSPLLRQAVLAVEDQRFYGHAGIDAVRLVGAFLANLRKGRVAEGASTITQQLARHDLLTRERTLTRKLREMVLATRIERTYTKDQILELYLNKVYFGNGFHGVETAARGYFGKPAVDLDLAEAALLAGLIRSPSSTAPTVSPDRALARRAVVLELMHDSGMIDRATAEAARQAPLLLSNGLQQDEAFGLYFKEAVRQELVERFGWARVSEGGLRVYSTLDTAAQRAAEQVLEDALQQVESRRAYRYRPRQAVIEADRTDTDYLQGALMALDPATGEVRALVGGRNFAESPFNRATQARRQPGSAFKPFVYAAALEAGYTPATLLTNLDDPVMTDDGEWIPADEHAEDPEITVRNALRTSSNRAAVRVIRDVGVQSTVDFVTRLNLGPVPAVPSLALGSGEVTLAAMTAAYGAFARGGELRRPHLIRRVEDGMGAVLWAAEDRMTAAISPTTAFLVTSMLEDVVTRGTAARSRGLGFTLPAAGKTGTTNDYADAWFVGFTPHLVAGVWVGFDQPRPIISRGYAAELAVPIWAEFMKRATAGAPPDWYEVPDDVVEVQVCSLSGQLPGLGCRDAHIRTGSGGIEVRSTIVSEYFRDGTEPRTSCHLHPGPGLLERVARTLGIGGGHGAPVSITPPPAPERKPRTVEPRPDPRPRQAESDQVEPEQKKRGFWRRIFGIGRDDRNPRPKRPPT